MNKETIKIIYAWTFGIFFGIALFIGLLFPSVFDIENVKAIFGGIGGILLLSGFVWWVVESFINKKWILAIGIILFALVFVLARLSRLGYI